MNPDHDLMSSEQRAALRELYDHFGKGKQGEAAQMKGDQQEEDRREAGEPRQEEEPRRGEQITGEHGEEEDYPPVQGSCSPNKKPQHYRYISIPLQFNNPLNLCLLEKHTDASDF